MTFGFVIQAQSVNADLQTVLQQAPSGPLGCPEQRAKLAALHASHPQSAVLSSVVYTTLLRTFKLKEQPLFFKKAGKQKYLNHYIFPYFV